MKDKIGITFWGAAGTVTGSKHLLSFPDGFTVLLDCGLFQGNGKEVRERNMHLGFSPQRIDAVILSHAHIDHSGILPRLYAQGFRGKIYATPATKDLCHIMLTDSAHIQEMETERANRRRREEGEDLFEPLYTIKDAEQVLKHFRTVGYNVPFALHEGINFQFQDAGHILGSASVTLNFQNTTLTFTGDIGRYGDPILNDPQPFPQSQYIICESTYGDRKHPLRVEAEEKLLAIVRHACVEKKGKLIIPAFSIDRTQEVIYTLDRLENEGLLPRIKVFVDSPLSVEATDITRRHRDLYNPELTKYLQQDEDPFGFENLFYITDVQDSKALNFSDEPMIIISSSGMAEAGRVKHHIRNNIENPTNTLLLVGYCTPESLGGRLKAGDKKVRIFGKEYEVRAQVEELEFYSAHADYEEIIRFLSCQQPEKVKKIFLVHGEEESSLSLKNKLMAQGFQDVAIPQHGEGFII